jgi:hypothetical protein
VSVGLNAELSAPPRFDGAGYAVLGEALAEGRGYREIDRPGSPRHAHFPPGYPAALAVLWKATGRSAAAAHLFSAACTVAAVLLAWHWFRTIYPPGPALILGLSLALNWTWGRTGGAIQSEPFYTVWEMLAVFATIRAGRRGGNGDGIVLGFTLAACILTRHIGVCLAVASAIDLGLRGRWRALGAAGLTTAALVFPWIGWLAVVRRNTQVGLLMQEGLAARVARQGLFYLQRFPDQVTGPIVEVGTVFRRSTPLTIVVNLWMALAAVVLLWGWARTLRSPRRRLAGLIGFTTLGLLLVWPFTEAGRFLIPLMPFVLVGATEGLAALLARVAPGRARGWAAGIVLAASIPYAAYAVATGRAEAQHRTHADYDAACRWIAQQTAHPGLVLARHPGEVFWQTGRQAIPPEPAGPEAVDRLIDRFGIVYLLVDDVRYANAAPNPLSRYVEWAPHRLALAWDRSHGAPSVRIYEVLRPERSPVGPEETPR